MLARLVPALLISGIIASLYYLVKYIREGQMTKQDRTRLVFAVIVAIAALIALFSVSFTSG
jgi:hypothetical protein